MRAAAATICVRIAAAVVVFCVCIYSTLIQVFGICVL